MRIHADLDPVPDQQLWSILNNCNVCSGSWSRKWVPVPLVGCPTSHYSSPRQTDTGSGTPLLWYRYLKG